MTKKVKKETEDFKSKYLRALADYQNLEKRMREEREVVGKNAVKNFILKFLPLLDSLETAEVFIKDAGLTTIKRQFAQVLKEEGLEEIEVLNQEFDPYQAEAVEIVEGEKDNIITEVLAKGYKFGDRVVRPAQVKVSKKI